jgi:hypothetical protein
MLIFVTKINNMEKDQRNEIKRAKLMHKEALKNRVRYTQERDNMVRQMIDGNIPNFGSLKITLINWSKNEI